MPQRPRTLTIQQSLKALRKDGCIAEKTERWNAAARKTQDLFGWCDILAMKLDSLRADKARFIGVQTTVPDRKAQHLHMMLNEPRACAFALCGGVVELHVVKREKIKRGGVAFRYVVERFEVKLGHYSHLVKREAFILAQRAVE